MRFAAKFEFSRFKQDSPSPWQIEPKQICPSLLQRPWGPCTKCQRAAFCPQATGCKIESLLLYILCDISSSWLHRTSGSALTVNSQDPNDTVLNLYHCHSSSITMNDILTTLWQKTWRPADQDLASNGLLMQITAHWLAAECQQAGRWCWMTIFGHWHHPGSSVQLVYYVKLGGKLVCLLISIGSNTAIK